MTVSIHKARLAEIQLVSLSKGNHDEANIVAMNAMEAVAYIAGEPWSAKPKCACPVITEFVLGWNNSLITDAERDEQLKELIPHIVNTQSTKEIEKKRSLLVLDWYTRVHTVAWLELLDETKCHADGLKNLKPIIDFESASPAKVHFKKAYAIGDRAADTIVEIVQQDESWCKAWSESWTATEHAVQAGAAVSAEQAAFAAMRTAGQTEVLESGASSAASRCTSFCFAEGVARAAAQVEAESAPQGEKWSVTRPKVLVAARDAADSALQPTIDKLQASARRLVIQLCEMSN